MPQAALFGGLEDCGAVLDEDGESVIEGVLTSGNQMVSIYMAVKEVEVTDEIVGEKREGLEKLMDDALELAGMKRRRGGGGGDKKRARKEDESEEEEDEEEEDEEEDPRFMRFTMRVQVDK